MLAAYITKSLQPVDTDQSLESLACPNAISGPICSIEALEGATVYFLCGVEPAMESPAKIVGMLIHQLLVRFDSNWKLQATQSQRAQEAERGRESCRISKVVH